MELADHASWFGHLPGHQNCLVADDMPGHKIQLGSGIWVCHLTLLEAGHSPRHKTQLQSAGKLLGGESLLLTSELLGSVIGRIDTPSWSEVLPWVPA